MLHFKAKFLIKAYLNTVFLPFAVMSGQAEAPYNKTRPFFHMEDNWGFYKSQGSGIGG